MKKNVNIIPVIHYKNDELARAEAQKAHELGADGIFLIAHGAGNDRLINLGKEIKEKYQGFFVGINLLGVDAVIAAKEVVGAGLDGLWVDNSGIRGGYINATTAELAEVAEARKGFKIFAGVAFKGQLYDPEPDKAASKAIKLGFIPTTSGPGTGVAADEEKVKKMSTVAGGELALASGITPENAGIYAPWCKYFLVATGISKNDWEMDAEKFKLLKAAVEK